MEKKLKGMEEELKGMEKELKGMEKKLKGMEMELKGQYHWQQETQHQNYRPFNFQAKRDSACA